MKDVIFQRREEGIANVFSECGVSFFSTYISGCLLCNLGKVLSFRVVRPPPLSWNGPFGV